eukprot:6184125-Pleurochrysis_carterae.AAC.2
MANSHVTAVNFRSRSSVPRQMRNCQVCLALFLVILHAFTLARLRLAPSPICAETAREWPSKLCTNDQYASSLPPLPPTQPILLV